jgi:hypothetical protein
MGFRFNLSLKQSYFIIISVRSDSAFYDDVSVIFLLSARALLHLRLSAPSAFNLLMQLSSSSASSFVVLTILTNNKAALFFFSLPQSLSGREEIVMALPVRLHSFPFGALNN